MHVDPTNVASRWFAVRAEHERVTRLRMAGRTARWFVAFLVLQGTLGDFDPRRFCDVIVFRRDTDAPVLTFSYAYLGPASEHLTSLRERVDHSHVFDFCRDVGLSPDLVVGPGRDDPDDGQTWVEISREARRGPSTRRHDE